MKRIFIAVDIQANSAFTRLINSFKKALRDEGIKWVEPLNVHLTLAFIGEKEDIDVEKTAEIVRKVAGKFNPFELNFSGTGIFRDMRKPRVIWLGVEVQPEFYEMQSLLCRELEEEGLYTSEKSFKPHITLGRIKYINDRELLSDLLKSNEAKSLPPQSVNELLLYESRLKPHGPEYHILAKAPFLLFLSDTKITR